MSFYLAKEEITGEKRCDLVGLGVSGFAMVMTLVRGKHTQNKTKVRKIHAL